MNEDKISELWDWFIDNTECTDHTLILQEMNDYTLKELLRAFSCETGFSSLEQLKEAESIGCGIVNK